MGQVLVLELNSPEISYLKQTHALHCKGCKKSTKMYE